VYRENCRRHLLVRARQRLATVSLTTYIPQNGALLSWTSDEAAWAGLTIDEVIIDRESTHHASCRKNICCKYRTLLRTSIRHRANRERQRSWTAKSSSTDKSTTIKPNYNRTLQLRSSPESSEPHSAVPVWLVSNMQLCVGYQCTNLEPLRVGTNKFLDLLAVLENDERRHLRK
jgi:hypothetical protein